MKELGNIKKLNLDTKYLKICIYALFVIMASILFERIISNIQIIQTSLRKGMDVAGSIMSPFIYAGFIAFFLNPFVRWLEQKVLTRVKLSRKHKRQLCSLLAILMFFGLIICVTAYILPEIIDSIYTLVVSLPNTISASQQELNAFVERMHLEAVLSDEVLGQIYDPLINSFGTVTNIISKIVTGTVGFGKVLFNFAIGLIIAFYMLIYKDGFKNYLVKVMYVLFKPETAAAHIRNAARINDKFEGFFVGKAVDSAIIGVICFVGLTLFIKPRFILLSSVIVGVTNMIPFFGPFIGGIPVITLALFYDLKTAAILALFIFALQQFDGYILGPKILGDSTGLSPFWVIAAILIGSALFGLLGMFLGVPIFAVIKMFLDEAVDKSFKQKYGKAQPNPDTLGAEGQDNEQTDIR